MNGPYAGYWGKLPAHGDFLRGGLPDVVVSRLDRWVSAQLAGARERHGERFEPLWHAAPAWYFTIRPGVLEAGRAATGIWTPSIDAVGRCFPFVFVILHEPSGVFYRGLPPFEAAIRNAVEETHSIQALDDALNVAAGAPVPTAAPVHDVWWCAGNAAWGTIHGALPVEDAFDWLIVGNRQREDEVPRAQETTESPRSDASWTDDSEPPPHDEGAL